MNEDALGELMERYGTKLTLYLDGYLCDLHEAEDLMIEVFAYLIAKKPHIRDGGFRAYLYQSARHMALRLLHKKRAGNCFSLDALTEEPEARELVEEAVQSAERARLLRTCMTELHEDYREALFLVYFDGLSHAETAAVMGKREKAGGGPHLPWKNRAAKAAGTGGDHGCVQRLNGWPRPSGGQGNWSGNGSAAVPVGSSAPVQRPVSL